MAEMTPADDYQAIRGLVDGLASMIELERKRREHLALLCPLVKMKEIWPDDQMPQYGARLLELLKQFQAALNEEAAVCTTLIFSLEDRIHKLMN